MERLRGELPLWKYWMDCVEHSILYKVETLKEAELLESLLIVRNSKEDLLGGRLMNGNRGAGLKYIEGKEEMTDAELIAALEREYYKEKEKNEMFDFGE